MLVSILEEERGRFPRAEKRFAMTNSLKRPGLTMRPPAKCAVPDEAQTSARNHARSARWLADARFVLDLTQAEMAQAIGRPLRSYAAWETGARTAPLDVYFDVRALLDARGLTSRGKIKIAG